MSKLGSEKFVASPRKPGHNDANVSGWFKVGRHFVRRTDISAKARFLALLYASYANAKGIAWPGTKTLMELTGWGVDAVRQARTELVKKQVIKRRQGRGVSGRFDAVHWEVSSEVFACKRGEDSTADVVFRTPANRASGEDTTSKNQLSQSQCQ